MDWRDINERMKLNREQAEAFRQRHAATFPALFEAEDRYRDGGSKEALVREIEKACELRPDLANEINNVFRWTDPRESN